MKVESKVGNKHLSEHGIFSKWIFIHNTYISFFVEAW